MISRVPQGESASLTAPSLLDYALATPAAISDDAQGLVHINLDWGFAMADHAWLICDFRYRRHNKRRAPRVWTPDNAEAARVEAPEWFRGVSTLIEFELKLHAFREKHKSKKTAADRRRECIQEEARRLYRDAAEHAHPQHIREELKRQA